MKILFANFYMSDLHYLSFKKSEMNPSYKTASQNQLDYFQTESSIWAKCAQQCYVALLPKLTNFTFLQIELQMALQTKFPRLSQTCGIFQIGMKCPAVKRRQMYSSWVQFISEGAVMD